MQRLYAILLWVAVILAAVAVVSVLVVVNDEFYPLISRRSKSVAASVLTTATMRTLTPAKVDPATLKDLSAGQKTLLKKLERAAGITGAVLGGAWAVASAVASVGLLAIYGREVQQATVETARILRFEIQNLIIDPKKRNTGNEPGANIEASDSLETMLTKLFETNDSIAFGFALNIDGFRKLDKTTQSRLVNTLEEYARVLALKNDPSVFMLDAKDSDILKNSPEELKKYNDVLEPI